MEEEKKEIEIQEVKPKKNILLFIIVSLVVLIGVGVLLLVLLTGNKDKSKDEPTKPAEQKEEEKKEEQEEEKEEEKEPAGAYEATIYLYQEARQVCGFNKEGSCTVVLDTIKTETKNPEFITSGNGAGFVLYDDNGLKIYNSSKKTIKKLGISYVKYNSYYIVPNDENTEVIGLGYKNDKDYLVFYNVNTGKTMYENKYKGDGNTYIAPVNSKYFSLTNDHDGYLLSVDEEKEVRKETLGEYEYPEFSGYGTNGNYFYVVNNCDPGGCAARKIYSKDFNLIYESKEEIKFGYYNNYIYLADGDVVKKYDSNGTMISSNDNFEMIQTISRNYIVSIKDNIYTIENFDDPSIKFGAAPKPKNGYYDHFTSGYYTREELDIMGETNKKEGMYVVIVYNEKASDGNYGMEYCVTPSKDLVKYPIKEEVGGRAKPVLYLYPTVDTKVEVKLAHPEYLSTTYPKYNNGWKVFAKPNGDLYDSNGKYYYALYWDEIRYAEVDFTEGFYVESKDAIKFLEEKLTYIGLNDKERNEFIMYWLPILEKNGKSLVYFELTNERETNNKLLINPTPDSMLRVNIHIKKVNNKVNIKEQKLETFKRTGFTVVEWGGMTY